MAPPKEFEIEPGEGSAGQTGVGLTEQAEGLEHSIGATMDSATQVIQDTVQRTKKSANAALDTIADGIDASTEYLTDRGIKGVVEDLETLIRRRPFHVLLLGVTVGYLLSRSRQR